ncbi:DgyrCDS6294 [Dimorphilus gyrociliatus]|uniref:DgyrCDS6294 n=1 Tax=Dimorphilus gyrociliatus TaxID=2664684 RepID=A0A7I8VQF8_9ANNE|nr:DgyrCDS6294 [Dimorphilus gyrociliatus]
MQKGNAILTMMVSYQKTEYMPIENQFIMPEAPPPESLMNIEHLLRTLLSRSDLSDSRRDYVTKVLAQEMPIEIKPVDPFIYYKMVPGTAPRALLWMRVRGNIDENDRNLHRCACAYISDIALLRTALVPYPNFKMTFAASLDHSMWFHSPFRADEWMLYECESPRLVANRGLIHGRVWKRDGTLAVSVAQEALIRGQIDNKTSKL